MNQPKALNMHMDSNLGQGSGVDSPSDFFPSPQVMNEHFRLADMCQSYRREIWQEGVSNGTIVFLSCLPGLLVAVKKFSHQPQEIKSSAIGSTQMCSTSSYKSAGHSTNPVNWAARAKRLNNSLT